MAETAQTGPAIERDPRGRPRAGDPVPDEWNRTDTSYREGVRLDELVSEQAGETPDRVALTFEGSSLSYRELEDRSNQVARRLRALGVKRETLVGVALERSLELPVALLGVLKAGGAYVPLDPDYPPERLAFMARDAELELLLTQPRLQERLPDVGARLLALDPGWSGPVSREATEALEEVDADETDLAYVIYTSGSTGRPKGVMIEHRSIVNRLFWMQETFRLGPEDVVAQKTPASFDVSVWEFFWPLMTGARMALARPGGHRDAGYLTELVGSEGVSVMHFVPSMMELFLEVDDLERRCDSLRLVISSGEALGWDLKERFFRRLGPDTELYNLYGPTEAAVDVTYWRCRPGAGAEERVVPIGRPVANTRIHVLGPENTPVDVGSRGELCIGGVQVGRGYRNRPDRTAAAFVDDPFDDDPDALLYRTGDVARWRDDGVLEFLGRNDDQVKIRGHRIELGEVESALLDLDGVKQGVVLVREDEEGDRRLVGWVVPDDGRALEEAALRRDLGRSLPDYMVPARMVVLDELPLAPNGKVARDELPPPSAKRPELTQAFVEADDPVEAWVGALWEELLEVDRVGIEDPFFELGGSSLRAARFVNRVQRELDEFIYVVTVFDNPTVRTYADFLRRDYPEAVARRFGETTPARAAGGDVAPAPGPPRGPVNLDDLRRLRRAVPRVELRDRERQEEKNPPAVFVLAPPRSGTTLLRVMLAGHPDLFAAAELQLLGFNDLEERRRAFSGRHALWLEGTVRALMEIHGVAADEAKEIMERYEGAGYSTRRFYAVLQNALGGRMLVDKSPQYALDSGALRKAERDFREPRYIHLSRHPWAMVRSFESYHMDQVLYLEDHPFDARALGELVWLESHRNIRSFLEDVPDDRKVETRFEDLVRGPEEAMRQICGTLGIEYDPELVHPYRNLDGKMVDGIYEDSNPMGDTRLLERSGIDPSVADKWKGVLDDDFLGDPTWEMARELGYDGRPKTGDGTPADNEGPGSRRGRLRRERLEQRRATRGGRHE